jgi:hypothetical protein
VIIFDLKCSPQGHVFEAWFGSSRDYDEQRQRGLVACPICGATQVEKAPMAPNVAAKGNRVESPVPTKDLLTEMAVLQKRLLKASDNVGERFPDEARAIHLGEAEARAIHGRATRADAAGLVEDGIPVSPLLFPVPAPGEEN